MSKKVLIVDDSRIVIVQLQHTIERLGCQTVCAYDANEGISMAAKDPEIELIIADINMPGMNGLDMCAEIRKIPHHKGTRIVVCTTENAPHMKEKAKALGVNAWLVKPINDTSIEKLVAITFGKN
ncbi:MAG: response regulator [Oligoflexales bacterium]|nr:response regulator [Oligoflexales bacterium]